MVWPCIVISSYTSQIFLRHIYKSVAIYMCLTVYKALHLTRDFTQSLQIRKRAHLAQDATQILVVQVLRTGNQTGENPAARHRLVFVDCIEKSWSFRCHCSEAVLSRHAKQKSWIQGPSYYSWFYLQNPLRFLSKHFFLEQFQVHITMTGKYRVPICLLPQLMQTSLFASSPPTPQKYICYISNGLFPLLKCM